MWNDVLRRGRRIAGRTTRSQDPTPCIGEARRARSPGRPGGRARGDGPMARHVAAAFGPARVPCSKGAGKTKPHGRQWLKQVTGSGGVQTVRVVENGAGGPKRVWKPATRRGVGVPEQPGTSR
jgi:hypothetical protein